MTISGQASLLGEAGLLGDGRDELIEGVIHRLPPESPLHAFLVEALASVFADARFLRIGHPLALGDGSEVVPDLALVAGSFREYLDGHPDTARLVIKVSLSTLVRDLRAKADLYAKAGVLEYWVVDPTTRETTVHRDPSARGYGNIRRVPFSETLLYEAVSVRLADF